MTGKSAQSKTRVTFIALDAFSKLGGMQRFNKRVVAHLLDFERKSAIDRLRVILLKDRSGDISEEMSHSVSAADASRFKFIFSSLRECLQSTHILVGQINLLPVAWAVKLIRPSTKIVLFAHGVEVWGDPVFRRKRFYDSFMLRSVNTIAVVSKYTLERMKAEFGVDATKFSVFPNAVDKAKHSELTPPSGRVLCVSRMAEHDSGKNIAELIRSIAYIKMNWDETVKLDIVGDGSLRAELQKLSHELDLEGNINFLGRVPDLELQNLYSAASVFALPSDKEGFGIVYLEAWQYELPVICGNGGAASEVVSDGADGFVVQANNTQMLAEKIWWLLSNPTEAKQMGVSGRDKSNRLYSDESFGFRLDEILRNRS